MPWFDFAYFVVIGMVFIPLERILALRSSQKTLRRAWQIDFTHFLATGTMIKFGVGAVVALVLFLSQALVPSEARVAIASQNFAVQFVEVLLFADLGFYVMHRLFHAVPLLWKFHAIHHSIEELDWLATSRVHPVDQILTKGASLLAMFALGFSPGPITLFAILYRWQSILVHSNTRIAFGPLEWVFASPHFHHWHHANAPEAVDKNFGGQLLIFDRLFGTLHMPAGAMPERYGTDEPVPATYLGQLAYPLKFLDPRRLTVARPGDPALDQRGMDAESFTQGAPFVTKSE